MQDIYIDITQGYEISVVGGVKRKNTGVVDKFIGFLDELNVLYQRLLWRFLNKKLVSQLLQNWNWKIKMEFIIDDIGGEG